MLPWLFAVLLVVNGALFVWGYQREKSREPELPPLPKGQYEIVLLSEQKANGSTAEAPAEHRGDQVRQRKLDFGPPPFQPTATSAAPPRAEPLPADASGHQPPLTAADAPVEATAGTVAHASDQPAEPATTTDEPAAQQPEHKSVKDKKGKVNETAPKRADNKPQTTGR
jgi:hypothetical protein